MGEGTTELSREQIGSFAIGVVGDHYFRNLCTEFFKIRNFLLSLLSCSPYTR